jgi:hypothetical protein
MNAQNLFHETVGKLTAVYKDHPAMLESFAADVNSAFDTLLEFGDFGGINKSMAATAPRSFSGNAFSKTSTKKAEPTVGVNKSEEPGQTVTFQEIQDAGKAFIEYARKNPVAAQKYLERNIIPEIEKAAEKQFSAGADLAGTDWKSAFKDAVSGKAAADIQNIKDDMAAKEAKANAAAEKDAQKEGAKAAKEQEKNFWKDQKKMGFRDEYNKMKAEDDANAAEAEKLMANGYDPSIYGDLKSKPGFLRRLKEKYLKWRSEAVDAIKCGDKVRLESAYTEIKDIVAIVEAMGLEANAVLG